MRFHVGPVVEGGGRAESVFIWTRRGRASKRKVKVFFRELTLTLTHLGDQGEKTFWISVTLQDLEALGPASYFLDGLCNFLREHAFAVADERTQASPLRLNVQVSAEDEDGFDRSDPVIADATSRICCAFWGNPRFRAAAVVHIDVPAAPNREALDLFLRGRTLDSTANDSPCVVMRVRDRTDERGVFRLDVLGLDVAGLRIVADTSHHAAAVADVVLGSTFPDAGGEGLSLLVLLLSAESAAIFAASLRGHRDHGFRSVNLAADVAIASDVADLCGAVLRCPAVEALAFIGVNFTAAAVDAAREATSGPDRAAALTKLAFVKCTFSDSGYGFSSLATAMSPSNTLQHFSLPGTPLQMSDMAALCSILARSEWRLLTLVLGDAMHGDNERCLSDCCIQHFFRMLPSMKTLNCLTFKCSVPAHMCRTVVDGIKYNYWIYRVMGLKFALDGESTARLQSEAESYPTANLYGRTAVYEAVTNPGNLALLETALGVLRRLSRLDDREVATALYLCLQLFLPFCCGDLGIVALGPGGAEGDARALSRGDRPR
jgi:hypothetical protein